MITNNAKLNALIMDECVLGHDFERFYPEFSPSTLNLGEIVEITNIQNHEFQGKTFRTFTIKREDGTTLELGSRHFANLNYREWVKPLIVDGVKVINKLGYPKSIITYRFEVIGD